MPLLEFPISLNTVYVAGTERGGFSRSSPAVLYFPTLPWLGGQQGRKCQCKTFFLLMVFICIFPVSTSPLLFSIWIIKFPNLSSALGLKPFTLRSEINVPGDAPTYWGHLECCGLILWHWPSSQSKAVSKLELGMVPALDYLPDVGMVWRQISRNKPNLCQRNVLIFHKHWQWSKMFPAPLTSFICIIVRGVYTWTGALESRETWPTVGIPN